MLIIVMFYFKLLVYLYIKVLEILRLYFIIFVEIFDSLDM